MDAWVRLAEYACVTWQPVLRARLDPYQAAASGLDPSRLELRGRQMAILDRGHPCDRPTIGVPSGNVLLDGEADSFPRCGPTSSGVIRGLQSSVAPKRRIDQLVPNCLNRLVDARSSRTRLHTHAQIAPKMRHLLSSFGGRKCVCCGFDATGSSGKQPNGGRGGIRTHGTLSGTPVFKTGALNHSATLPDQRDQALTQ